MKKEGRLTLTPLYQEQKVNYLEKYLTDFKKFGGVFLISISANHET